MIKQQLYERASVRPTLILVVYDVLAEKVVVAERRVRLVHT